MAKDSSGKTVVRRVKASESGDSSAARTDEIKKPTRKVATKKSTEVKSAPKKVAKTANKKPISVLRPFFAIGRYFRDSWRELKQVSWPNRRATWALTLAVILFSLFFAAIIMLFDWIFNYVIQEVIL